MQHALDLIRRKAWQKGFGDSRGRLTQLHMSPRTFEIQFTDEVGHSVGEELRRVRLARAKDLLAKTEFSITRVAGLVGYADSAYFAKFFRQRTGQTPSEFRRQRK